ncbi:ParB/RepB/Spo0J family partition protein [Streptomyces griseofuscus]|uniref:ParB/RepB/Spo0J family partition protein n=1 Tax=Streptomyces griseofuscus TaxID=146922 RepID=UPI0036B61D4C
MSKADQLGRGRSFGSAANARSSRRDQTDKAIHGSGATLVTLTDLPVPVISDNPDNPRNHLRNLEETTESVREVGVILPIVVATVDAYLRDRPDRAGDLDDGAQYVVVDGHRRLEASRRAGLAMIPVRVDNARVATDETLLEAAFIANYHRDDMTDLEEANALKQLVDYYGSQTKASKRLGIAQSTLASKLSLLKLTPELQKDLQTGERKVEHVRNLGKLDPEEQKAKADERAAAARAKAKPQPAPAPTPTSVMERSASPADYHGVIIPESAAVPDPIQPQLAEPPVHRPPVPEPREAAAAPADDAAQETKRFPYLDGREAGNLLLFKMPPEERDVVFDMLARDREKRAAQAT